MELSKKMGWKIPLFKILFDEEDIDSLTNAIKAGTHWADGPCIKEFEKLIADYIGTKYCVLFNSGTSALHAALLAHDIKQGDEVIVPSFTFISTANAPIFVGAKPIFADIEEETLGIDSEDVKEKITSKTRAIIPVHYGGCPCKIRELKEIADDYDLVLIEDAAESFGAKIGDKKVGIFGNSAMFSFCQNKIIATGEGGAVTTDSKRIYKNLKLIGSHGRDVADYFSSTEYIDYIRLGYNFRMSNITAALGVSQIKKVNTIIDMRRDNAEYLFKKLSQRDEDIAVLKTPNEYFNVYQMFTIKVKNYRDDLIKHLLENDITTKVYFFPVHLTHFYRNELRYTCELPITEKVSKEVLSLPMYPTLSRNEMDYMVEVINKFFEVV